MLSAFISVVLFATTSSQDVLVSSDQFSVIPQFPIDCETIPSTFCPSTENLITVPPVTKTVIKPFIIEKTSICPVGSVLKDNVCNTKKSEECPYNYIYNGKRCVKKFVDCPLHYEFNELKKCVLRKICPENYVWKYDQCQPLPPKCPNGLKWNGNRCEVVTIECQPGLILYGSECVNETFTCPIGVNEVDGECEEPEVFCLTGFEMEDNGFCSKTTVKCPSGSVMINNKCQCTIISCPPESIKIGHQCFKCRKSCRPGFEPVGDLCVMVIIDFPITCQLGTYKIGNTCCYYLSNPCYHDSTTCLPFSPRPFRCPPQYYRDGNRCLLIQAVTCPQGYYKYDDQCYLNTECAQNGHDCVKLHVNVSVHSRNQRSTQKGCNLITRTNNTIVDG